MRRFVLFFVISFIVIQSCCFDFYRSKKDGDLWRFPILEPFELISPTNDDWFIILKEFNPYPFELNQPYQLSYIDSIGVINNKIFIHSIHANLPKGRRPAWIIIEKQNNGSNIISFCEEKKISGEIQNRGLKSDLIIYSLDSLIRDFQDYNKLPEGWKP